MKTLGSHLKSLLLAPISLLIGIGCSQSHITEHKSYLVTESDKNQGAREISQIMDLIISSDFEEFRSEKYSTENISRCYRPSGSDANNPKLIITISRLQQKSFYLITVYETDGETDQGAKLNALIAGLIKS